MEIYAIDRINFFSDSIIDLFNVIGFKIHFSKPAEPEIIIFTCINENDIEDIYNSVINQPDIEFLPKIIICRKIKNIDYNLPVNDILPSDIPVNSLVNRINNILNTVKHTRDLNPLTGLPGNYIIEKKINSLFLAGNSSYSILYIDINNFKAYNDSYGFSFGDRIICFLAKLIRKIFSDNRITDYFIGHIGGDDFIVILPSENSGTYVNILCAKFDSGVLNYYNTLDRTRKFIISRDRNGIRKKFLVMSISITRIDNRGTTINNLFELNKMTSYLKKEAKKKSELLKKSVCISFSEFKQIDIEKYHKETSHGFREKRALIEAMGELKQDSAIPVLIDILLNDKSYRNRKSAAYGLGCFGRKDVIGPLVKGLDDPSPHVRTRSVEALGKIGDPSTVNLISDKLLNDPNRYTRMEAATALGKIADKTGLDSLIKSLDDRDYSVICRSIHAIGEIANPEPVPLLINLFKKTNLKIKLEIIRAMSKIYSENSLLFLIKNVKNNDSGINTEIINAITVLSRYKKLSSLFAEYETLFSKLLCSVKNYKIKRNIIRIAGNAKLLNLTQDLKGQLKNNEPEIVSQTLYSLHKMGKSDEITNLDKFIFSRYNIIKNAAITAAGSCGNKKIIEALRLCLKDRNESTKELAADSIISLLNL